MAAVVARQASVARILDSLGDAVYVTDTDRQILYWSAAAERITGWRADDVIGRTCFDNILVHQDRNGRQLCGKESCPLHRAIQTGTLNEVPLLVFAQTRGGERIPVQVSVAPMRDDEGQIIGGVETFRDVSEMLRDLERAKTIQQRLMRLQLPEDPRVRIQIHCSQCDLLGGDFYRVERLGENRYAMMISDVMGHGAPAALHAVQLRALWESSRDLLGEPGAFLAQMNNQLHCLVDGGLHFATALHLVLDLEAHQITWASAGHPAPMICRRGEQPSAEPEGETRSGNELPLGLVEGTVYDERNLRVGPGDRLLLFTDGAIEVIDREGEQTGCEGLQAILRELGYPGADIDLREVEERLLARSCDLCLPDDLTLIDVSLRA